jgi:pyruvate dehydrogenase E2 component (dihydrolipoamide acetyltransferase)
VDKKDVGTIALELHQLVEKARTRKVTLDELMGASFTVSNQGGIGGGHFTPIIHKPEAAILGVGRAVLRPVYLKEDEPPSPRWMLPLALSYDHRLADGADAARFVRDLAQTLEHFGEPME